MLLLRDLIGDLDIRFVAGEAGLDRPVRWVHISELPDPTPWLSGGELLLTTGLQLTDAPSQRALRRAAGRATGSPGSGSASGSRTSEAPRRCARRRPSRGFPLFEVPYDVPFIAVTEKASTHIVNEHYTVLQRAISAHERLERIVLSERGLEGVAAALAALVGGTAMVLRRARRGARALAHGARARRRGVAAIAAELRERVRGGRAPRLRARATHGRALALPVRAHARASRTATAAAPQAWLVAAKDRGALGELDRLVLHQAVTVVALELLRRRVADDTERRLAGDVLPALVSGELAGDELARRLEPFGLRDRVGVLVLAPARPARRASRTRCPPRCATRRPAAWRPAPAGSPARCCRRAARTTTSCSRSPSACARACRARRRRRSPPAPAARSPPATRAAPSTRRAARSRRASSAASANGAAPPPLLATYRDLGSFQLLLSLQDDDALRLFCDSILAPIEDGEGAYGGELMRSLEAFIECNGQWERAARQLYCHRHTLRYRIRRVEELTAARWTPRATASSSGSPCAAANWWHDHDEENAMKVGVPTEIKTDEYRVALTPSGVRELVEHGHEVVVQAGAGDGSAIVDDRLRRPGRARSSPTPTRCSPRPR